MIHCFADDTFSMKGITFHCEKQNSQFNPEIDLDAEGEPVSINFQIKKIDAIYNPEYEDLVRRYRLPVFFKSLPVRSEELTYAGQGFIDNGRK